MTKTKIVLSAIAGLMSLASCGGGDSGEPFTEDVYCNQRAAAECDGLAACAFSDSQKTACISTRKGNCVQEANALKMPPARVFREAKGLKCISDSKRLFTAIITAQNWQSLRETCSRTFEGVGKAGDTCNIGLDCEAGLICDKGVCGPAKVVGIDALCSNPGEQCGAGQYCGKADAFYKCTARGASNSACDATKPCLESLRCVAGACKERLATGDKCTGDGDCAAGLVCDPFLGACSSTINLASQCSVFGGGAASGADASVGN
ncbi:MAG: hypothetical protein SF187_28290 [Deltaproteobacteria bacterium]|nr:hypothetical protein [Deltaproteobacteria bacterium]